MRRWTVYSAFCSAFAIAMLGAPGLAGGQQQPARPDTAKHVVLPRYRYRILGVFDDQTGDPVEGVEVIDVLNGNSALTTKTGTVALAFLPDGGSMVRLRKVGYGVQTFTVPISPSDTAPITITMTKATTLAKVVVTDSANPYHAPQLRAFEERRKIAATGYFISEAEMRKADNRTMANLLISKLPGLGTTVSPVPGATWLTSTRRPCSGPAMRQCRQPDCYPSVYIDGVKVFDNGMRGAQPFDYSKISPIEYAGVEFYAGSENLPEGFSASNSECGTLFLWTRER